MKALFNILITVLFLLTMILPGFSEDLIEKYKRQRIHIKYKKDADYKNMKNAESRLERTRKKYNSFAARYEKRASKLSEEEKKAQEEKIAQLRNEVEKLEKAWQQAKTALEKKRMTLQHERKCRKYSRYKKMYEAETKWSEAEKRCKEIEEKLKNQNDMTDEEKNNLKNGIEKAKSEMWNAKADLEDAKRKWKGFVAKEKEKNYKKLDEYKRMKAAEKILKDLQKEQDKVFKEFREKLDTMSSDEKNEYRRRVKYIKEDIVEAEKDLEKTKVKLKGASKYLDKFDRYARFVKHSAFKKLVLADKRLETAIKNLAEAEFFLEQIAAGKIPEDDEEAELKKLRNDSKKEIIKAQKDIVKAMRTMDALLDD